MAGWSTTDASLSLSSSSLGKRKGPRETGSPMERKNLHLSINIGFHPLGPAASRSALSLSRVFWTRYLRKGSAFKGQRKVTEGLGSQSFFGFAQRPSLLGFSVGFLVFLEGAYRLNEVLCGSHRLKQPGPGGSPGEQRWPEIYPES